MDWNNDKDVAAWRAYAVAAIPVMGTGASTVAKAAVGSAELAEAMMAQERWRAEKARTAEFPEAQRRRTGVKA